jgi:uncharacterized membrane protein YeaQ/YmgE (transglycosylase-associated protein family)
VAQDKVQVKIPRQIRLKTEFFIGFGMEELIKTLIVGAIAGVIAYILYKITNQTILATLLVIGAIVVAVISLVKGNNNFSMIDMIKNIVKYETMQKEYRYRNLRKLIISVDNNEKME